MTRHDQTSLVHPSTIAASAHDVLSVHGPADAQTLHDTLANRYGFFVQRQALDAALREATERGLITCEGERFASPTPGHVVRSRPDSDPSGWTWVKQALPLAEARNA